MKREGGIWLHGDCLQCVINWCMSVHYVYNTLYIWLDQWWKKWLLPHVYWFELLVPMCIRLCICLCIGSNYCMFIVCHWFSPSLHCFIDCYWFIDLQWCLSTMPSHTIFLWLGMWLWNKIREWREFREQGCVWISLESGGISRLLVLGRHFKCSGFLCFPVKKILKYMLWSMGWDWMVLGYFF